jgi:hypothetical protein
MRGMEAARSKEVCLLLHMKRVVTGSALAIALLFGAAASLGVGHMAAKSAEAATTGQAIANIAVSYRGYPYTYAGMYPWTGFDCSGFAWWVYHEAGINFPRGSAASYLSLGTPVSRNDLQPGDLVFFQDTYIAGPSHVEIYIGNGWTIGADTPSTGVTENYLGWSYWTDHYLTARRLVGSSGWSTTSSSAPQSWQAPSTPQQVTYSNASQGAGSYSYRTGYGTTGAWSPGYWPAGYSSYYWHRVWDDGSSYVIVTWYR